MFFNVIWPLHFTCKFIYLYIHNYYFRKFVRDIESMLQNKSEIDESCEHLKEKIEFMECGRADINNQINYLVKEMERELNSFKSKYEALHK